jgi:hypothetical protein
MLKSGKSLSRSVHSVDWREHRDKLTYDYQRRNAMASTHVHVILTGLISLIPRSRGWIVRLQDARNDTEHPHVPSIVVERGNLSSPPTAKPYKCNGDGTLDAWLLGNGKIEVKSTINSGAIYSSRPLPYVLKIEEGCGGVANCPIVKAYNGVRMQVTKGSLEATKLEDGVWQWGVSKNRPVWIAEEVCWHFEIDGSVLELWLPHKTGKLKLKVGAPQGGKPTKGGDIELRLQNTLEEDIFPRFGNKTDSDPHAPMFFYQASAKPRQEPALKRSRGGRAPKLPHYMHRLTSANIGSKPPMAMQLSPPVSLRVNCPPAQWNG